MPASAMHDLPRRTGHRCSCGAVGDRTMTNATAYLLAVTAFWHIPPGLVPVRASETRTPPEERSLLTRARPVANAARWVYPYYCWLSRDRVLALVGRKPFLQSYDRSVDHFDF